MHKINSAKFLESINNRSIINQYKSWPACFSVDLDRNISRISRCLKLNSKETPAQVFSWEFCVIFHKTLLTEHLRMTAPADCLVPTKVLFSEYAFSFFPSFYPFITYNCNYGSLFGEGIKMKIFFHL